MLFRSRPDVYKRQAVALVSEANTALGVTVVDEVVVKVCSDGTRVEAVTASDSFVGDIGIIATGASALPSGATSSGGHTCLLYTSRCV